MAITNRKIAHSDLIEENVFNNTIQSGEKLLKTIKDLESGFKELLTESKAVMQSNPFRNSKDIADYNKQVEQAQKAQKALLSVRQEKVKVEEKLKQLSSEEIKRQEIARQDAKERRDYLKSITVLENTQAGTLEKLAAKNKQLSAEQRKLNLATLEGRTRLKEINTELDKNNDFIKKTSDSLKAQKINVGNYTTELRILKNELASLDPDSKAFADTAQKAGLLKDKIDDARSSIKELSSSSKSEQLKDTFLGFKNKLLDLDFEGAAQKAKQFAAVASTITFKEMIGGAKNLGSAIFQMGKVLLTNPIFIIGSVIVGAALAIKDFTANIGDNTEALKINKEAIEELKKITQELAKETKEINQSILVSDGKITDFQKRKIDIIEEATQKFIEAKKIERDAIKAEKKLIDEQVNSGTINILNRLGLASDLGILETKEKEFNKRVKEINVELARTNEEIRKNEIAKLRKLKSDEIAKEKKELRDLSRDIKAIQIEQIDEERTRAEEKLRFDAKNRIEDTKKIIASYSQKAALIKEIEKKLQKDLEDIRTKAINDAIKTNLEFEQKLKEEQEKQENEEKTAFEKNKNESDIRFQESNRAKILSIKEGTRERLNTEIEAIELERDLALASDQLTADQRIIIEKEAQEKINALKKNANEKLINDIQSTSNLIAQALDARSQRQQNALDKEISDREKSIERQEGLAERGLTNELAFQKQKLAEAELAKEEAKEKDLRRAKVIAYWNAFTEALKQDTATAAFKALAQIALADTIAGAFKDGVEKFDGKGTETSDSNIVLLSKNESVLTAKGTRENPGLATAINKGTVSEWFRQNGSNLAINSRIDYNNSSAHIEELRHLNRSMTRNLQELKEVIINKKETSTHLTNLGEVIQRETQRGLVNVIKYINKRPRI